MDRFLGTLSIALLLLGSSAACSATSSQAPSERGDGGPDPTPPSTARCVGTPSSCDRMLDCFTQSGCSDRSTASANRCVGTPNPCSWADDETRCVDVSGCSWRGDDGAVVAILGTCSGTPIRCGAIKDADTCQNQPSGWPSISTLCQWDRSGFCQDQDGTSDWGCGLAVTEASAAGDHLLSPSHVRDICRRRAGCTWYDAPNASVRARR